MLMDARNMWENIPPGIVRCQEVIICSKEGRGKGTEDDPYRMIVEVFTKEGCKIAEYDSMAEYIKEKQNGKTKD